MTWTGALRLWMRIFRWKFSRPYRGSRRLHSGVIPTTCSATWAEAFSCSGAPSLLMVDPQRVSVLRLHDLPIRVFLNDLAIPEFQKVNPANLNLLPVLGGACQSPSRDAVIARNPVLVVSIVNIRGAFETCCETLSNVSLPNISLSPRVRVREASSIRSHRQRNSSPHPDHAR